MYQRCFSVPIEVATRVQVSYQHELGYVDRLHVATWVSAKYAVILSLEFASSHAHTLLESWAQVHSKQALHNTSIILYTCTMVTLNQRHCLLKGYGTVVTTSHSITYGWAWDGMGCLCTAYTLAISWFTHSFQWFACIYYGSLYSNSSVDWVQIWIMWTRYYYMSFYTRVWVRGMVFGNLCRWIWSCTAIKSSREVCMTNAAVFT